MKELLVALSIIILGQLKNIKINKKQLKIIKILRSDNILIERIKICILS